MRVAGDARDALKSEVEERALEPGSLEEGDEEGSETAVDVEWDLAPERELGE